MPVIPEATAGIPADRYAVEREIGRGGFATVFQARDLRHHRRVAIKVLNRALASGVGSERFQTEIELAASLAHPNIVPVFDSGVADDTLFYVMPLVEGESLRERLQRDGALPVADVLRIARDMANALAYAHGRNVIHRDIKPENVLLMQSGGHALVADFGIAKALSADGRGKLTVTGAVIGTPLYMSPEQSIGMPVDARADIYSFAAVVFEMLTGTPPMPGTDGREALVDTPTGERSTGQRATPTTSPARLPREVRAVLARALSGDAAERHPSVDAFITALTQALDARGMLARLGESASRWSGQPSGSRVAMAAGVLVVLLGAAFYLVARGGGSTALPGIGLVVFPFRATTAAASEWREAIPDLLATQLDGTPGVRVADPWSLWLPLRDQRGEVARSPDPGEARRLARKAQSCCFVLGTVSQVPGRIDVSVRVYQVSSEEPWHTFTFGGSPDSVGTVVRHASLELIRRLAQAEGVATTVQVDRTLPRTPAALKEWLIAREHLRRGRFDSADVAITRSLAEDSSYVPSLTDAVGIRSWLQFMRGEPYSGLRQLAERAVSLADTLPTRTRLRAEAMLASIRTDGPAIATATSAMLALDPSDFEAWNLRSYSHMIYGWQYGVTPAEVREAAERLYQLDTTSITSLSRRTFVAASLNDPDDVRAQLVRLRRSDTTVAVVRGMSSGILALLATDAEFTALVPAYKRLPATEWIATLRMLRMFRPDRTEQFALATLADEAAPSRPIALGTLVQLLAAGSRWRMLDSMRAAGTFGIRPGFATVVDRMAIAATIAGNASPEQAVEAVARLSTGFPPDSAQALFTRRNVWHDGWLIGAFHAMYGDTALARRWSVALGALPSGGSPREYHRALETDVAARIAVRRGDRTEALAQARRAYDYWDVRSENSLEMLPEPAIRYHFASMLRDAGRADSARAIFGSLVPPSTWMGFYTARAALDLAELQERAGNSREAERNYLMATLLWENADDDVAPLRSRARVGLRRLSD